MHTHIVSPTSGKLIRIETAKVYLDRCVISPLLGQRPQSWPDLEILWVPASNTFHMSVAYLACDCQPVKLCKISHWLLQQLPIRWARNSKLIDWYLIPLKLKQDYYKLDRIWNIWGSPYLLFTNQGDIWPGRVNLWCMLFQCHLHRCIVLPHLTDFRIYGVPIPTHPFIDLGEKFGVQQWVWFTYAVPSHALLYSIYIVPQGQQSQIWPNFQIQHSDILW